LKQIIQSFKTGKTILEDIPAPQIKRGTVLIQTTKSLVSLGTERMLVEFGKSNLLSKVRQQPDKVKQVLDKIKSDGFLPTIEAVFNKLEQPIPLGYCNVGKVIAVGDGVSDFKVGDRVASNGNHAEFVCIPENLTVHIPENVSDDEATFTVIGSIGLQGLRLASPTIGETFVVIGLGLIGLITTQLLIANGCTVIGVDLDESKLTLANKWGVIPFNPRKGDVVKFVESQTNNLGADGVIITASAKDNEIISQSAKMSRKRGRIILVGVVGLDLSRSDFYEKELTFQVSCSYGPGRYDENYEQKGIDYPVSYVRWTEKRNFETVLKAISSSKLNVKSLITELVPLQEFSKIYNAIGSSKSIASILKYSNDIDLNPSNSIRINSNSFRESKGVIGVIGAGNFTRMTLLPIITKSGALLKSIASSGGITGTALAKKYNFANSTTDYKEVINDDEIDLIFITTRHDKHASMVIECLQKNKNVFVEKPLALNNDQLDKIISSYNETGKNTLTVGFNRRFSPHSLKVKSLLNDNPISVIATMNAGSIPSNVWIHDMNIGGGRIIGEACHFIDLITFFTGSKVISVCMNAIGINPSENIDTASILLKYENGSTGVINYFANGSREYPKERIEVYSQERTAIIDNFRVTTGFGFKNFKKLKTSLDKGHKNQFHLLIDQVKNGGSALIPIEEIINTTRASFASIESLKNSSWVQIK